MDRRDFIKLAGSTGLGVTGAALLGRAWATDDFSNPRSQPVYADYEGPMFILVQAVGGWDPVMFCDPKGGGLSGLYGEGDILTASERGYGKRTPVDEYPKKGRGTQGVIALQTSARNGRLVGATQLSDRHEVLLISDGGTLVRTHASEISQVGRNTQGVTLIRLGEGESLQAIERLDASLDVDADLPDDELPEPGLHPDA